MTVPTFTLVKRTMGAGHTVVLDGKTLNVYRRGRMLGSLPVSCSLLEIRHFRLNHMPKRRKGKR